METLPPLLCPFFFFVLVILRTVLLFSFGLCLLVPPVSSLFFFVLLPCFLCWFALFFSWSRPPSLFSSSFVCVCSLCLLDFLLAFVFLYALCTGFFLCFSGFLLLGFFPLSCSVFLLSCSVFSLSSPFFLPRFSPIPLSFQSNSSPLCMDYLWLL